MKILMTLECPELEATDFLDLGIISRVPRPLEEAPSLLLDELISQKATGLIAYRRPSDRVLLAWQAATPEPIQIAYVVGVDNRSVTARITAHKLSDPSVDSIASALEAFERSFARTRSGRVSSTRSTSGERGDVLLVGAGIVNLITALHLQELGHRVRVLDASPEPGGNWEEYGCTHAGDDARMFTFTEMDGYGSTDFAGGRPDYFRKSVTSGGWNAKAGPLGAPERAWVEDFERVPSWLARTYTDDILALNADAYPRWLDLIERLPHVFEGSMLKRDILRIYSDRRQLLSAKSRHTRIGALTEELAPNDLAERHPVLRAAVAQRRVAGALLVPGFTVNVHKFVNRLIEHLQGNGVSFRWNTPVTQVYRDSLGRVEGFECALSLTAGTSVVASPGIDQMRLLDGSRCEGKIHGVLGGWMRVANTTALSNSIKLARKGHSTEDANITVATDEQGNQVLIIGSGYGYIGQAGTPAEDQLDAIRLGIEDTIKNYFPDAPYNPASQRDDYKFKFCVRPWTATSLGVFEVEEIVGGGSYVITGGHNTGGFAQAPSVAAAVAAALGGEEHPMHWMYSPTRLEDFAPKDVADAVSDAPVASMVGVLS